MASDSNNNNVARFTQNDERGIRPEKFTCYIIGESTLPVKCGEMLLQAGHTIYGIISNDSAVNQWAAEKNIPCIKVIKSRIFPFLSEHEFDYLLSINGDYVMPEAVLALPRQMAINYHDSPLPLYAGMYATSWALMNREKVHAISWHQADTGIDTGDILNQLPVPIEPRDTAFTLNLRCYETALKAFEELLGPLETRQINKQKQDLTRRTYFGYYLRPNTACIFSFNNEAHNIDAFLRALDFGSYDNPLGMPKIMVGKDFFIIPAVEVTGVCSTQPPGTVAHMNDHSITLATRSADIHIKTIYTLEGGIINIPEFTEKYQIREGYVFMDIEGEIAQKIHEYYSIICRYERYWEKRLRAIQPPDLFTLRGESAKVGDAALYKISFHIPGIINLTARSGDITRAGFLIAVYSIYLYKLTGLLSFDLGYTHPGTQKEISGMEELFAMTVPLHIELNPHETFQELAGSLEKELYRLHKHKTFIKDITMRYPGLKSTSAKQQTLGYSTVTLAANPDDIHPPGNPGIHLVIPGQGSECVCYCHPAIIDKNSLSMDINEINSAVAENNNIKLTDIRISNDLTYSEMDISPGDLDDFGF